MDVDDELLDFGHDELDARLGEEQEDAVSLGSAGDEEEYHTHTHAQQTPVDREAPYLTSQPSAPATPTESLAYSGRDEEGETRPNDRDRSSFDGDAPSAGEFLQDSASRDSSRRLSDSQQLTHALPSKPNFWTPPPANGHSNDFTSSVMSRHPERDHDRDPDRPRRQQGDDSRARRNSRRADKDGDRHYSGTSQRQNWQPRERRGGSLSRDDTDHDRAPSPSYRDSRDVPSDVQRAPNRRPPTNSRHSYQERRSYADAGAPVNADSERNRLAPEEEEDPRFIPGPGFNADRIPAPRGRSLSPPRNSRDWRTRQQRASNVREEYTAGSRLTRSVRASSREPRDFRGTREWDVAGDTNHVADTWTAEVRRSSDAQDAGGYSRNSMNREDRRSAWREPKTYSQGWSTAERTQALFDPPRTSESLRAPYSHPRQDSLSGPEPSFGDRGSSRDHGTERSRHPRQPSSPPHRVDDRRRPQGRGYPENELIRPRDDFYPSEPASKRARIDLLQAPRIERGDPSSRTASDQGRSRSASIGPDTSRRYAEYEPPAPAPRYRGEDDAPSREPPYPGPNGRRPYGPGSGMMAPPRDSVRSDRGQPQYEAPSAPPRYETESAGRGYGPPAPATYDPPAAHSWQDRSSNHNVSPAFDVNQAPRVIREAPYGGHPREPDSPPSAFGSGRMRGFQDDLKPPPIQRNRSYSEQEPYRGHNRPPPQDDPPYQPERSQPLRSHAGPRTSMSNVPPPQSEHLSPVIERRHHSTSPVAYRNGRSPVAAPRPPQVRTSSFNAPPPEVVSSFDARQMDERGPNNLNSGYLPPLSIRRPSLSEQVPTHMENGPPVYQDERPGPRAPPQRTTRFGPSSGAPPPAAPPPITSPQPVWSSHDRRESLVDMGPPRPSRNDYHGGVNGRDRHMGMGDDFTRGAPGSERFDTNGPRRTTKFDDPPPQHERPRPPTGPSLAERITDPSATLGSGGIGPASLPFPPPPVGGAMPMPPFPPTTFNSTPRMPPTPAATVVGNPMDRNGPLLPPPPSALPPPTTAPMDIDQPKSAAQLQQQLFYTTPAQDAPAPPPPPSRSTGSERGRGVPPFRGRADFRSHHQNRDGPRDQLWQDKSFGDRSIPPPENLSLAERLEMPPAERPHLLERIEQRLQPSPGDNFAKAGGDYGGPRGGDHYPGTYEGGGNRFDSESGERGTYRGRARARGRPYNRGEHRGRGRGRGGYNGRGGYSEAPQSSV